MPDTLTGRLALFRQPGPQRATRLFTTGAVALSLGLAAFGPAVRIARAGEEYCTEDNPYGGTHLDVSPALIDLGPAAYVRMDGEITAFTGGLYPGGSNLLPAEHQAAGLALSSQIVPRAADGSPDPEGKITLISVGMSNTSSEFRDFRDLALLDPDLNPQLVIVNGASAGRTAEYWTDPASDSWQLLNANLAHADVTPLQVQAAWVKLVHTGPGDFPEKPEALRDALVAVAHNLLTNYPNIKQAYFSSRTRSYTYWNGLSPEPAAYESGFAVKWLVQAQLEDDPALNFDPTAGPVVAPWLAWGPYLWADGLNPRSDGLVWTQQDMVADCTHPSSYGRAKVAQLLLDFFKTQPTAQGWFLDGTPPPPPPPPAAHRLFVPLLIGAAPGTPSVRPDSRWMLSGIEPD